MKLRAMGRWVAAFLLAWFVFTIGPTEVLANPFETLNPNHWSYEVLEGLSRRDLIDRYNRDRLRLGYHLTQFDIALSVGEALERLKSGATSYLEGDVPRNPTLKELIALYNASDPLYPFDLRDEEMFAQLISLVGAHLDVLGFDVPPDVPGGGMNSPRVAGGASGVLERLRIDGEGRRSLVASTATDPRRLPDRYSRAGEQPGGPRWEQRHVLRLSGPFIRHLNFESGIARALHRPLHWSEHEYVGNFQLKPGAIDMGITKSAAARLGQVTGDGFSDLVLGDAQNLSGMQAGAQMGKLGSNLLVAQTAVGADWLYLDSREPGTLTAWDTTYQLNDRFTLGASMAHLEQPTDSMEFQGSRTVMALGGTYQLSQSLTLTGEMGQSSHSQGEAGAMRVGAVLHPLPDLTVGALYYSADEGYRRLFDSETEATSRLDLSAEIGQWILSLRRQRIVRADTAEETGATTLGLQFSPMAATTVTAAHTTGQTRSDGGTGDGSSTEIDKTEIGLRVRFDKGLIALGYALENSRSDLTGPRPIRTEREISLEHSVGPDGRAIAGFSIADGQEGSETSSNVGLRYDFEDASVTLLYEIFEGSDEQRRNVTTAEVSIKF